MRPFGDGDFDCATPLGRGRRSPATLLVIDERNAFCARPRGSIPAWAGASRRAGYARRSGDIATVAGEGIGSKLCALRA
jgi:hypothetical protein